MMPRAKKDEGDLDAVELTDEQRAAIEEEKRVEEASAAFFAAEKSEAGGEEDEAVVDEVEAEPVLGDAAGEADDGSGDSAGAEDEGDERGDREVGPTVQESSEEEKAPAEPVVDFTKTAAERRPTTMGGGTIITE